MKKALCIGLNQFLCPGNDLAGCVPDAVSMKDLLGSLGYEIQLLIDSQATRGRAWDYLSKLIQEAKSGSLSRLAVTWSGHGTHYNCPDEPDGLGEALVCYDTVPVGDDWDMTTLIMDRDLRGLLNQVPESCLVEIWLDTCYSGGMDRAFSKNRFIHNPGNKARAMRLANTTMPQGLNRNIVMWCACSEGQTAADAFIRGNPHGAFTYYWLKAYRHNTKADRVRLLLDTRAGLRSGYYDQFPRLKCWDVPAHRLVGI